MVEQQKLSKRMIVVIGSFLGVIASVLGIVAVFFPDAFNLSKKSFAAFSVQVDSPATVNTLHDFLESQKGNIVELDVSICVNRKTTCPVIRDDENSLSAKFSTEDAGYCDGDKNNFSEGVAFYFDDPESKKNSWSWEKFQQCKNGNEEGINRIKGHFLVPTESGFGQGWTEWLLTPISAKDIQLKNY